MVLAAAIRHPSVRDHVLLRAGYRMKTKTVANLTKLGVRAWVHHPGFDFLDNRLGDAIPSSRTRLYHTIKRSFSGVANKVAGSFDLHECRTTVSEMILALVSNKDHAVWAEQLMTAESQLFAHSANMAYLSLIVGLRLKEYIFTERDHGLQRR